MLKINRIRLQGEAITGSNQKQNRIFRYLQPILSYRRRPVSMPGVDPGLRRGDKSLNILLSAIVFLTMAIFALPFVATASEISVQVCKSISTWNDFHANAAKHNNAENLEAFDAMVDLAVKDAPDCLVKAFPSLTPETQSAILSRAREQANGPECKKDYLPDLKDMDWCQPNLRENSKNCFGSDQKPFYWCKAYPPLIKLLKPSDSVHVPSQ